MTEISPRHRNTTAPDDHQPQSVVALCDIAQKGPDEFMGLLAELGVPEHFLADVDLALLDDELWDHIPDLDEDLEKGAKEVAFNFDWSWLQQDISNPALSQNTNPIIARGDWRSPPAPSMVRPKLSLAPMPVDVPVDDAPQAQTQAAIERITEQGISHDFIMVPSAPTPEIIPIPKDIKADEDADLEVAWITEAPPSKPASQAKDLVEDTPWLASTESNAAPIAGELLDLSTITPAFDADLVAPQSMVAGAEWVQPMSVRTPLSQRNQKRQQAQLAAQARREAAVIAKAARRQQRLEQAAEVSLNRAALLLQRQAHREARRQSRLDAKTARHAAYQAWLQSRMIQHQLPMMIRLSTGISAITLFSASALWGGSQVDWGGIARMADGALPRFEQKTILAQANEAVVAADVAVQPMSFQTAAIAPPPAPDMKVAPIPAPLPITAPDHKTVTAPIIQASKEVPVQATETPDLPDNIAVDQPIANAPTDEKPLPIEITELRRNAIAGNRQAQHDLGAFYAAGRQIERDFVRAAYWFREAAMRGVPNAQYNLGVLLQRGLGVPQDTVMATQWYQRAAHNNHPEAQYNLGVAYADGIGVSKNPRVAGEWFEKAAVAGLARAAFNLGVMYELGMKGQADIDRAVRWYARAAEAGERDARESLERLNIAEADIAGLASELAKDLAVRYPAITTDAANDQPLNADQVAEVQSLLSELGLYRGSADGQLGSKTTRAIANFQEKTGLPATGKATESLLTALRRQTGNDGAF